jgi:hypothetical protein
MSFSEVKLVKCHFEKKNQFKKGLQNDVVWQTLKKIKKLIKKKLEGVV